MTDQAQRLCSLTIGAGVVVGVVKSASLPS